MEQGWAISREMVYIYKYICQLSEAFFHHLYHGNYLLNISSCTADNEVFALSKYLMKSIGFVHFWNLKKYLDFSGT